MECPKCRKVIDDIETVCPYCGTQVRADTGKSRRSKKRRNEKTLKNSDNKKSSKRKKEPKTTGNKKFGSRFKVAVAVLIVIIAVILIAVLISALTSAKGEKYAEAAAEYIGKDLASLEKGEDIHFKDESDYTGVNNVVTFDYVYESDKKITADGIAYPQWAVFLEISDANFITDVTYTDFSVVKKDMRGEKHGSLVNLDHFSEGAKQSVVLKEIDMDPYSISHSQKGVIIYTYKYYYTRDNGDEQQVILRAAFDENGKYEYSTTELIYPENM